MRTFLKPSLIPSIEGGQRALAVHQIPGEPIHLSAPLHDSDVHKSINISFTKAITEGKVIRCSDRFSYAKIFRK